MLGRVGILESVAGDCEDDLGAGLDLAEGAAVALSGLFTAVEALEEGRHGSGAGRLDEDALVGGEPLLGREDLRVLDDLEASARFGDGMDGSVPAGGASDPDGGGHGLGIVHRGPVIEGGGSRSLDAEHPGELVAAAEFLELLITLPVGGDVPGVADGEDVDVGGVAKLLDDFEGRRLLTLDAVGVDRIDDGEVASLAQFAHEAQGVVEVPPDGDNRRPVDVGLDHLAPRDASGGEEDGALHAGPRGVGCRCCGGIPRGGAENGVGSLLGGLGDGHGHPTILERPGRIEPLVLDVDLAASDRTQLGRMNEGSGTLAQRDDGSRVSNGKELPVASDHAAVIEGFLHRVANQERVSTLKRTGSPFTQFREVILERASFMTP